MKIAVIGSGISGLAAAYFLNQKHEVWLFEQADYLGGHAHTVEVNDPSGIHKVDTGFIVCNKKTYPNFLQFLKELDVKLEKSSMGFSVKDEQNNIEFAGQNLNTIFAQRKNLLDRKYWQMLLDINKFNKYAKMSLLNDTNETLSQFLNKYAINDYARRYYILPLISAIWSASITQALEFPIKFLFKFLDNHGLLGLNSAPQWYTIKGGSIAYVKSLQNKFHGKVFLKNKVQKITRSNNVIKLKTSNLEEDFDKVVFAIHSDQVLDILDAPNNNEIEIFSNIKYQSNNVTLHTDITVLPKEKRAWASWNYFINNNKLPNLTYNMNTLQNLQTDKVYCVSLNLEDYINKDLIIDKYTYSHPIYDDKSLFASSLWDSINQDNIYYAGAYWGYGFHEDGINSAIRVVNRIDQEILCNTPYTQAL